MENRVRRFLVLLVTVALLVSCLVVSAFATQAETAAPVCYEYGDVNDDGKVDLADAVRVLYYVTPIPGVEQPVVNQDCDFNGDTVLDSQDAMRLLWASMDDFFGTAYLKGTIHNYYEPVWQWDTAKGTASVSFKCGCGEEHTFNAGNGVTVTKKSETAATCTAAGAVEWEAKVVFGEKVYTDAKTMVLPATKHSLQGEKTCEKGRTCANCDFVEEVAGHSWKLTEAATCKNQGVETYTCAACGGTKTVELGGFSHSYELKESKEVQGSKTCEFVKENTFTCVACGDSYQENDTYEKHVYKVSLSKEATCVAEGTKTYSCTACDHSYEEKVSKNDAHAWNDGVEADGVITYSCTACGETKTAVSAKSGDTVDKTALKAVEELQVEEAAVKLDEKVKESIQENVAISVETKSAEDLNLTAEQKAQVGDNKIYDFTMTVDGSAVSDFNGGKVTVSLPYTIQEGDDVDCIDVWYIGDDGKLDVMKGTYSNGFVTFTTDHFSYYTVTRLKPSERCAIYGHMEVKSQKAATCTEDGYLTVVCQRCGKTVSDEKYPMLGHKFSENIQAATCTEDGSFIRECTTCHIVEEGIIPATGHNLIKSSTPATCNAQGVDTYDCDLCDYSYEEYQSQLEHNFQAGGEQRASCDSHGHKTRKCTYCGTEEIYDEVAPTGHKFLSENAVWQWSDDYTEATVTLVCTFDAKHTKQLTAVVTKDQKRATCTSDGDVTYTATASFNKAVYTDVTETMTLEAQGHKPTTKWITNETGHYYVCTVCGVHLSEGNHSWKQTVIQKPTCAKSGQAENTCEICGYKVEETLPATGQHTYNKKNVCTGCGKKKTDCEHLRSVKTEVDLSKYGLCGDPDIFIRSCDCGESSTLGWDLYCFFPEDEESFETVTVTLKDGTKVECTKQTCTKCGLSLVYGYNTVINKTTCTSDVYALEMLVKDGKTIAQGYFKSYSGEHPSNVATAQQIDLSKYGLCGGVLVKGSCYCGKSTYCYTEEDQCQWIRVEEESKENREYSVSKCEHCKTVMEEIYEYSDDGAACGKKSDNTKRYSRDGEVVFEVKTVEYWTMHEYEPIKAQMKGDSCEDGVVIAWTCQCGDVDKEYYDWHDDIFSEKIDLSMANICADNLVQWSCACGKSKHYEFSEDSECNWNLTSQNDSTIVSTCEECGATETVTRSEGAKDQECEYWITNTAVYRDKTGKLLATAYDTEQSFKHDIQQTGNLLGKTCVDGVQHKVVCADCGKLLWEEISYEHIGFVKGTYDISAMDACATVAVLRECVCGADCWFSVDDDNDYCDFDWVDGGNNWDLSECNECGLNLKTEWVDLEKIDSCHVKRDYTYTISKGDAKPVVVECQRVDTIHAQEIYSFSETENCEDGYELYMKCLTCGAEEYRGEHHGHSWWTVDRKILSEDQLCGTLVRETASCACGAEGTTEYSWIGGRCEFVWTDWDEKTGMDIATCSQCGAVRKSSYETTPIEGETCKSYETSTSIFFDKDGKELFADTYTSTINSHDYLCTFEMYGETCEDGYTVYRKCVNCGYEVVRENEQDCDTWMVEQEIIYEAEDICGPIKWEKWSSPCGDYNYWYDESTCHWNYRGDKNVDGYWIDIYECADCGLRREYSNIGRKQDGACVTERTYNAVYYRGEQQVGQIHKVCQTVAHEEVYDFRKLGETCEDGYYVIEKCADCDYIYEHEELQMRHENLILQRVDTEDIGLCSGEIEVYGCPCGEKGGIEWNFGCESEHMGEDAETGLDIWYCDSCGTTWSCGKVGQRNPETCIYEGEFYLKTYAGNSATTVMCTPLRYESHEEWAVEFILNNPEGDCEDGYTAITKCADCGAQERYTGFSGHDTWIVERIDAADIGACGGELRIRSCACGKYDKQFYNDLTCENVEWIEEWYDEDEHHSHWETKCLDCGMIHIHDVYETFEDGQCYGTEESINTFTLGDWSRTFKGKSEIDRHDWENQEYTLLAGAESCEDGMYVKTICSRCGKLLEEYETDGWHGVNLVEKLDLTQYGAICGEELLHYRCPCGSEDRYEINEENGESLDWQNTDLWITDAISDKRVYSVEGEDWIYSSAWTIICSVTDPVSCGLRMRMAEYWLDEGCEAVEYQTWQLGYDDKTGTCQKEITVATGEKLPYHDYTVTYVEEAQADGGRIEITNRICAECGSYYNERYYYDNTGAEVKYTRDAVNTLNSGETKEWHTVREYGYRYDNRMYETLTYNERVYDDGRSYWSKEEYTYDFENSCSYSYRYTNSDGERDENTNEHYTYWTWETVKQPTCTQHGVEFEGDICYICDQLIEGDYWDLEPRCHDWSYDWDLDLYVCDYCGLENVNGASGEIVMEDLTDSYDGTNYVVGYWNRGELESTPHVSVILKDIDGDNLFVLLNIGFDYWSVEDEGVRAVAFSTTEAKAAAEVLMAEMGYTGSYAIRFSFVPDNGDDTLDYAITFDSLMAV